MTASNSVAKLWRKPGGEAEEEGEAGRCTRLRERERDIEDEELCSVQWRAMRCELRFEPTRLQDEKSMIASR